MIAKCTFGDLANISARYGHVREMEERQALVKDIYIAFAHAQVVAALRKHPTALHPEVAEALDEANRVEAEYKTKDAR